MTAPDLKAIQERAKLHPSLQSEHDRAALLEHIARQDEVVRMLTEALEKCRASLADADRMVGWTSTKELALADAALKAASEGSKS